MFAIRSEFSNDQLTMRHIMKKLQYSTFLRMDLLSAASSYSRISASFSSFCSTPTAVAIDKAAEFVLDFQRKKMINTHFLLRPFLCIMKLNAIMANTRKSMGGAKGTSAVNLPRYIEVNKNAVMLDDIELHWYTLKEDCAIVSPSNKHVAKKHDDLDLDLYAVHREAQKYNDFNDLQQKLDTFLMQCLLQHILIYLKDSWLELTRRQRHILRHVLKPHLNVFDLLTWFGYDCLIRPNDNDFTKVDKYNKVLNNTEDIPSNNVVVENLAVDFGMNFSFSTNVIISCDKHFEGCLRNRMSYTKLFEKQ